jgi:hypothetical protein
VTRHNSSSIATARDQLTVAPAATPIVRRAQLRTCTYVVETTDDPTQRVALATTLLDVLGLLPIAKGDVE